MFPGSYFFMTFIYDRYNTKTLYTTDFRNTTGCNLVKFLYILLVAT